MRSSFAYHAFLCVTLVSASRFFAETGGLQFNELVDPLPLSYNVSDFQRPNGPQANSYWTSSYVYGIETGHEYMLLSHVLLDRGVASELYRASIVDISDPSYYKQFTHFGPLTLQPLIGNQTVSDLNLDFGEFGFVAATDDLLGPITTWSKREEVAYNFTIDMSAPLMFNGGDGTFSINSAETNEFSMPAGLTVGTFVINNETVTIDPLRSLTWYDRQYGSNTGTNWTWFELHLDSAPGNTGSKYSIWFYPSGWGTQKGFATVRDTPGVQTVVPCRLTEGSGTWTSTTTNVTYAQQWTVDFADGLQLNVSSIRGNQELVDPTVTFITYEGFVNVVGTNTSDGRTTGFGLVEVSPPS